jgi:hypothetical protein
MIVSRGGVLFTLALVVAASACHAFYQVRGKVRSCADQAPIAGASVKLAYPGERGAASADEQGDFIVAVNDPPGDNPATLSAEAPGYLPAERTVYHSHEKRQDICLQPASAGP